MGYLPYEDYSRGYTVIFAVMGSGLGMVGLWDRTVDTLTEYSFRVAVIGAVVAGLLGGIFADSGSLAMGIVLGVCAGWGTWVGSSLGLRISARRYPDN